MRQEALGSGLNPPSTTEQNAGGKSEAAAHEAQLGSKEASEVELQIAKELEGQLQAGGGDSQPFLSGKLNSRQTHAAEADEGEEEESTALLQERQVNLSRFSGLHSTPNLKSKGNCRGKASHAGKRLISKIGDLLMMI